MFGLRFGGRAARVSVVVPLYNHAAYIGEAVASVLAQGAVVKELIVIDDGSTDGGALVMAGLARTDPRIRFSTRANKGAHATINEALSQCSAPYCAILNSDDAYQPGRLNAMVKVLEGDAGIALAASGVACMDAAGRPIANGWYDQALAFYRAGAPLAAALINGNFVMTTSNFVFRRSLPGTIGGFAPLRYVHDLDFLLRALALDQRIEILEDVSLRYRVHATNTIAEDHGAVRAELALAAAGYLTTLWDRPGAAPIDWGLAVAVQTVARTHALDRAVALCMAALRRGGALTLDQHPVPFKSLIRDWV